MLISNLKLKARGTELQRQDISGILVRVEITEVMLRGVLSSIGQMKNNNFDLSGTPTADCTSSQTTEAMQTTRRLSVCSAAVSTVAELVSF